MASKQLPGCQTHLLGLVLDCLLLTFTRTLPWGMEWLTCPSCLCSYIGDKGKTLGQEPLSYPLWLWFWLLKRFDTFIFVYTNPSFLFLLLSLLTSRFLSGYGDQWSALLWLYGCSPNGNLNHRHGTTIYLGSSGRWGTTHSTWAQSMLNLRPSWLELSTEKPAPVTSQIFLFLPTMIWWFVNGSIPVFFSSNQFLLQSNNK